MNAIVRGVAERRKTPRDDLYSKVYQETDPQLPIGEPDVVAVSHQIVTGHCVELTQYRHRIGLHPKPCCQKCESKACPAAICVRCGTECEDAEHALLRCPASDRFRSAIGVRTTSDLADRRKLEKMVRWLLGRASRPPDL